MISAIYENKDSVGIISWHPDRLARNSVDGGQIISLKFPTFWFEPTPQGLFMLQVAFGQSKYYSDNLSENVRRGIRQKIGSNRCLLDREIHWKVPPPFRMITEYRSRQGIEEEVGAAGGAGKEKDTPQSEEDVLLCRGSGI